MSPVAFMAAETADAQADEAVRCFQAAPVIAMYSQAGGMSAGTCKLMDLQGRNDIIVSILGQRVAYFDG